MRMGFARRAGWAVGFLAAAAMILGAPEARAQTIRMWTFLNPDGKTGREKVLKQLITGFEAANPGAKVQVEPQIWQQISDKFLAAAQTGSAPDVVWLQQRHLIAGIKLGTLANLDELFLKNWSKDDVADVDQPLWRYGSTPTAHYQMMLSLSVNGQFYRADLFKEAGIDPDSLTTWDRLIAAAEKLTVKDASGTVVRWGFGQFYPTDGANMPVMGNVLLDLQGSLFDKQGHPAWATPAGLKGLALELDMIRTYHITPPTAINAVEDDGYDQFNAGRVAMSRGNSARLPNAMAVLGTDKVGYLRTPGFTAGQYSRDEVLGWPVGVWSGSKNKELAGKWVEYMTSKAADTLWVTQAGMIPIRKSTLAENAAFFAKPENHYLAVAAADMVTGWVIPEDAANGFNDSLDRAAQEVFVRGAEPETALKNAEAEFTRRSR